MFPTSPEEARRAILPPVPDDDGLISFEESIGVYVPGGAMESILFGAKDYYKWLSCAEVRLVRTTVCTLPASVLEIEHMFDIM